MSLKEWMIAEYYNNLEWYFFDYLTGKYISDSVLYQTWKDDDDTELEYAYWLQYQAVVPIGNYIDVLYHRYVEFDQ